jgi:hypothetical protein
MLSCILADTVSYKPHAYSFTMIKMLKAVIQEKIENLLNSTIFRSDALLIATFQILNKLGLITEES